MPISEISYFFSPLNSPTTFLRPPIFRDSYLRAKRIREGRLKKLMSGAIRWSRRRRPRIRGEPGNEGADGEEKEGEDGEEKEGEDGEEKEGEDGEEKEGEDGEEKEGELVDVEG
jgi:hypothetical protein